MRPEENHPPELREAVRQLWDWQRGGTSFYCSLYTLFGRADMDNRRKLFDAFPAQAQAFKMWNQAGNYGDDLFREFGLNVRKCK